MNRLEPDVVEYYDQEAVRMICEKYGMQPMEALRTFVCSKTHEMLEHADMGMTDFGADHRRPKTFRLYPPGRLNHV